MVVVVVMWLGFCDGLGGQGEEVRVAIGEWLRGKAVRWDGVIVRGAMVPGAEGARRQGAKRRLKGRI